MQDNDNFLKYGDCICLSSTQGYLMSQGFTKTACYIQVHFNKSHTYQRNMRDFVFQIVPKMNYDAFKEFQTFKKYYNKASGVGNPGAKSTVSQSDKIKMNNLKKKLGEESLQNQKSLDRRRGEMVTYGDELQLLHYDSKYFVEGSKNCSELDKNCNLVRLIAQGNRQVCFVVEPRYKYRNEGQPVNYGDVVVFRNLKSNQYLHISTRQYVLPRGRTKTDITINDPDNFKNIVPSQIDRRMLPDEFAALYEVNTSSNRSNFAIKPYRRFQDEIQTTTIKGGQVVRFQHSESQGYICSDDNDFTGDSLAEVFLWNFKGKASDIESMNTQTFFELEIVDPLDSGLGRVCQYSGNSSNETANEGGMFFRLRHLNTGRLIVMQDLYVGRAQLLTVGLSDHIRVDISVHASGYGSKCILTSNNPDYVKNLEENSIFRLVSTGVDMESGITCNTSVQIQHVASRRFLQHNKVHSWEAINEDQESELQPDQEDNTADGITPMTAPNNMTPTHQPQTPTAKTVVQEKDKEILDERLFKKIDEQFINLGSRDMLTLEETASFENAFFINPESRENLSKVLFVHTSVNCLNNLLSEISNTNYGASKERQNKIESILTDMIEWMDVYDEENTMESNHEQCIMDAPYSLKSNDEITKRKRNLQTKQKYMRELRVVECIVDILHMPFASGQFDFMAMTQDMAITNLLKLCYRLLSKIVIDYRLNEMYTSQWIGLFLQHVLRANDENAVGADDFITQLCDENDIILEKMINTQIIEEFVEECDKGKEAPRLLRLLTAICASRNGPILRNQHDIVIILTEHEEAKKKLLMPLRRLKKRFEIEVCLDLATERWVPLIKVCQQFQQVMKRRSKALEQNLDAKMSPQDEMFVIEYECFCEMLSLFAETCLNRNVQNQKKLMPFYESKILSALFHDDRIDNNIRAKSLKLFLMSCLDIEPFHKLQVPSGQAVWKDLLRIDYEGDQLVQAVQDKTFEFKIKSTKVRIPPRLLMLKEFTEKFLKKHGVVDLNDDTKNEMIVAVLSVVKFMVNHGFYQSQAELSSIAIPVVELLNGSKVKKRKEEHDLQENLELSSRQRYFPETAQEPQIKCHVLATEILLLISNLETDAKSNVFLSKLKQDIEAQIKSENGGAKVSSKTDLDLISVISQVKGFESINEPQYVCVLFDLMLYRITDLQAKAFGLLVNYFTRKRIIINCLASTQILESNKSTHILNEIKQSHLQLKKQFSEINFWLPKHIGSGITSKEEVTALFEKLTRFCVLKEPKDNNEPQQEDSETESPKRLDPTKLLAKKTSVFDKEKLNKEKKNKLEEFMLFDIDKNNATPHKENQRLMQQFDIVDIALAIIKQKVDRQTNYNDYYKELIKSCYRFLIAYVRGNFQNQLKVYDDVDVFMRDMDTYQVATLLFYEIFKDNTKFLTLNVTKFIRTINNTAEEVALNQIKKAIFQKLLEVFCKFERRLLKQNQTEIIVQMTADTTRSNVLYLFQAEGAKELSVHIEESRAIRNQDSMLVQEVEEPTLTQEDQSSIPKKLKTQSLSSVVGTQILSIPVFNVIQLLQLVTLCCNGKSDIAASKCKESILNFKVATNIITMSQDFWPLKIALFEYIIHAYMDNSDPNFMAKPSEDDGEEEDVAENAVDESDVGILLRLIEILNQDLEDYLNGEIINTKIKMPNGMKFSMRSLNEKYIFQTGLQFIKAVLKRKTYDVGSVELKFYVLAKNVAACFYHATQVKHQVAALDLLKYIYSSERHAKYLDNVTHPAKKGRQNKETYEFYSNLREEEEEELIKSELTNSNRLSQRIMQLSNSHESKMMKEVEFIDMVAWVTNVDTKVKKTMAKGDVNPFSNVTYQNVIGSLIRLLDARVLSKELQITGLSILRKIIEMENKDIFTPSADWDTDNWVNYKRIIQMKQDIMIERGTIQFLCKHISEVEDADTQEECLLVLISLVLGGNQNAQATLYDYMRMEALNNKFLMTIRAMLVRNFELTKKFMIEKNAKLEMIMKMKQRQNKKQSGTVDESEPKTRRCCFGKGKKNKVEQSEVQLAEIDTFNNGSLAQEEEEEDDNLMNLSVNDGATDSGEDAEQNDKPVNIETLEENQKQKQLSMVIRILRFLQLLCEGHHANLQNNLRQQVNEHGMKSPKSFDFVAYVSSMFTIYVKSYVNVYSTNLGNQIIESLIEFIQGPCRNSQRTLVDTKAIDCCRDLLNTGSGNQQELETKGFGGKRKDLLNDIKMNSVKLLLSILEGPVDVGISARISASLGDYQVVIRRMESVYYQFLEEELKLPPDTPEYKVQNSLQKDSFNSCILEGFDILSLLNQLVEVNPDEVHKLDKFREHQFFKFYVTNSGSIEVNTEFDILRINYPLQPKCRFLTAKSMFQFENTVERESGQHKLLGLCSQIPFFIEEMDHLEIMSHAYIQITPMRLNYLRDLSTLIAVMVSVVIVSGYKYSYQPQTNLNELVYNPDDTQTSLIYSSEISYTITNIIFGLGCVQLLSSFMLVVGFMVNNANLIVRAGWRERISINEIEMLIEKKQLQGLREAQFSELDVNELNIEQKRLVLQIEGPYSTVFFNEATGVRNFGGISIKFEYYWVCLTFLISNGQFIFNIMYFVFSVQGLIQSPVFYSFHLLDVINRFPALQNVIKSVTLNANQLLMTSMLGAIIIYNYAIFAFLFLSDNYMDSGTINVGLYQETGASLCKTLLHCYLSTINYGLRFGGGIGDALNRTTQASWNAPNYFIRFIFDISFFLLITTIILNVVFGIIIDSFAQLREESMFIAADIKNVCFMCNLDRYTIDRDTNEGFDFHTEKDHNLWNYVYFIIHLQQKEPSDFNGTESYIDELLANDDMQWFPAHKSIRLIQSLKMRKTQETVEQAGEIDLLSSEMQKLEEVIARFEALPQ